MLSIFQLYNFAQSLPEIREPLFCFLELISYNNIMKIVGLFLELLAVHIPRGQSNPCDSVFIFLFSVAYKGLPQLLVPFELVAELFFLNCVQRALGGHTLERGCMIISFHHVL
jgi:hypothetical protein